MRSANRRNPWACMMAHRLPSEDKRRSMIGTEKCDSAKDLQREESAFLAAARQ